MATLMTDEEINSIIMKCPDETDFYPDPDSFVNKKTNKCKYAYVTLVMLGDLYIAGAIVLAHSIRKCGSKVDLVVLVTPDVSTEGKKILSMFFTHVIMIDYVNVPNWRTKRQPHRKYLELVFTKFHIFNLVQYEKVLLIDADALVLKYPDHLFTLDAPAGCFLEDKELIIAYDKDGNYVLPKDGELQWYKKYCKTISHGKLIPKEYTDRLKTQFGNSGIGGGLMLLQPKLGELENIIKDVSRGFMKHLVENKFVFPEQQYLALRYSGKWTSMNPRFFGLQGFPHWKVLYGLQYGGDKPFCIKSKIDISIRVQFPDFILWHEYYAEMTEANPDLLKSPVLSEANEMKIFFNNPIKQQRMQINRIDKVSSKSKHHISKNIISKIFNTDYKHIHTKQSSYYHINRDSGYKETNLSPMYDDIKESDYAEPIRRLSKYFKKGNYYQKILNTYTNSQIKKLELDSDNNNNDDKDLIMLEYIKCKKDMCVIIFWPTLTDKINESDINTFLQKYGIVHYIKQINLTSEGLFNLMFWMHDEFTYESRFDIVTKKIKHMKPTENNQIMCVFLENVNRGKISGSNSLAKQELKNTLKQIITYSEKDCYGMDELIHVSNFFYQTVNYSKLLLNKNSIDLLQKQNIYNIISQPFILSDLKLQTLKKWISLNLSLLEQNRLLIFGSTVLYAHGYRESNDVDIIYTAINDSNNSAYEKNIADKLHNNFGVTDGGIPFVDVSIEDSQYWKESWTKKNNELLNYFDIPNFTELVTNPVNYFYFEGFKCYLLEHEIVRKIFRNKIIDHADFMILSVVHPEQFNRYVEMTRDNIMYKIDSGQTGPELEYDYLLKIGEIILTKYPKTYIKKFKSLVKKI